jgi:hypothetical protein
MRDRAAHEYGVPLPVACVIADEQSLPAQESQVFDALDRTADVGVGGFQG